MANWIITDSVNLRHPTVNTQGAAAEVLMVPGDNKAHTWQVIVRDGYVDADLSGKSCYAYFVRKDNVKVLVNGTITGNVCSVTLDSTCYAEPGFLRAVMILSATDETIAIYEKTFRVNPALPDQTVDPGETIPSIDDLLAEIGAMRLATADANAAASAAQAATTAANTAAQNANTKAEAAQTATNNANQATTAANTAAANANTATQNANTKAEQAQTAANNANQATTAATEATAAAQTATDDANEAAQNANEAASAIAPKIDSLDAMDNIQNARLTNIESVTEGFLYDDVHDSVTAYSKTVPDNTLPFANLDMVGGKTLVWNQMLHDANTQIAPYVGYGGGWNNENGSREYDPELHEYTLTGNETSVGYNFDLRVIYSHDEFDSTHVYAVSTWAKIVDHGDAYPQNFSWVGETTSATTPLTSTYTRLVYVGAWGNPSVPRVDFASRREPYDPFTIKVKDLLIFDLTQMFGAGNEPTVEEFEAMFPADYYPYSEPMLMNFSADKVVCKGRNLLDGVNSGFKPYGDNGAIIWGGRDRVQEYQNRYLEKGTYTLAFDQNPSYAIYMYCKNMDTEEPVITGLTKPGNRFVHTFDIPVSGNYHVWIYKAGGIQFVDNVIFTKSDDSDYAPYFESTNDLSPIVSKYFPDGMKSVGDVYDSFEQDDAGKWWAVQRVGSVDLGTVEWKAYNSEYHGSVAQIATIGSKRGDDFACPKYMNAGENAWIFGGMPNKTIVIEPQYINCVDTDCNSASDFASQNAGVNLFYELANYIRTEVTDTFPSSIGVETGGTLTFVNDQGDDYRVPLPNQETWKFNLGSDVVRYDTEQSLTDAQKITARNNIGAADKDEVDVLKKDDKSLTRRVENLEAAASGQLYRVETDSDDAYSKDIPSDALPWATLDNVGGKTLVWNQLAINGGSSGIVNGIEWTIDPDGIVIANGTATANSDFPVMQWTPVNSVPAGHVFFIGSWLNDVAGGLSAELATMTYNSLVGDVFQYTRYGGLYTNPAVANKLYYRFRVTEGTTVSNMRFRPIVLDLTAMFGAGNEPTVEQIEELFGDKVFPYSEPTLLNFSADKVVSKGRNLYDGEWHNNWINNEGASTGSNVGFLSNAFPILHGGNYTLTVSKEVYNMIVACYDDKMNFLQRPNKINVMSNVFDLPDDTRYVIIGASIQNAAIDAEFMKDMHVTFVEGEYAGAHIPYRSPITTDLSTLVSKYFPTGMKSVGTVHDEIDLERGVAVQRVGSLDLSTLTWRSGWEGAAWYNDSVLSGKASYYASIVSNIIADNYEVGGNPYAVEASGKMNYWFSGIDPNRVKRLTVNTGGSATPTGMFYFELETPIETPIDPDDLADLAALNVEAGGTLSFANDQGDDYRVPIPNAETYMIKLGGEQA